MKACFQKTNILLPNENYDAGKWAVVACDQYTSQPEYWENVEKITKDVPSTYNIVFPEVYLEEGDGRIQTIQSSMKKYMEEKVLEERVKDGFVLVERDTASGKRLGLVGALDLEQYEYKPGTKALVRATEGTIESRIPPRMRIRRGAELESPHVMLLVDDKERKLIEPLFENRESLRVVYDTELMLDGGHLKGYAVDGDKALDTEALLYQMEKESGGFFLAVGDGNHSLATAKACWDELKVGLSAEEREIHPQRYALVELVNLYSEALIFEPIHRVLFDVSAENLMDAFKASLQEQNMSWEEGNDVVFVIKDTKIAMGIGNKGDRLAVDVLQSFLDCYMEQNAEVKIDYIHGEDAVMQLSLEDKNCGILLDAIDKYSLFPAIIAGGALPRKTFSMGEAFEKRYYMECRKIMK